MPTLSGGRLGPQVTPSAEPGFIRVAGVNDRVTGNHSADKVAGRHDLAGRLGAVI